jgi:hypothetical protein
MNSMNYGEHQEAVDATVSELGEAVQERIVSGMRESEAIDFIASEWGWDAEEVAKTFRFWKWG